MPDRRPLPIAFLGLAAALAAGAAAAQSVGFDLPSAERLAVHDTGWRQLTDRDEVLMFLVDLIAAFAMTAAIAHHPVAARERSTVAELELPGMLYIYALIGLTVGFLVMQHGYLIGFVIFGIGGLLRFRTIGESAGETLRMILVTVIGLCVGLDLPAMAVMVTAVAWITIQLTGGRRHLSFEVKYADEKKIDARMAALRDWFKRPGVRVVSTRRAKFKPVVEVVIDLPPKLDRGWLAAELARLREEKGSGVEDWHLD